MRRSIHKFIKLMVLAVFSASCSNDTDTLEPYYVIEAFVFSGEPVSGIVIKELTPLDSGSNAEAPVIDDAEVILSINNTTYSLDYNDQTESYFYPGDDLNIETGQNLKLEVRARGRYSYAETEVPEPPEDVRSEMESLVIPELTISFDLRDKIIALFDTARLIVQWDNINNDFHYIVIQDQEEIPDPILPDVVPEEAKELLSSFRFITEPTLNTSFDVIGVALETYGTHVAKVYRVNQEYADLFQNDTQDSRDLNAPPSNVIGAFGIFSAFASDNITFEVVRE